MNRKAILVVNTAKSDSEKTNVDLSHAKRHLEQITDQLKEQGEYSFETIPIFDYEYLEAQEELNRILDRYSENPTADDKDCLIVYYFGHALDRTNGLHLQFKNSKPEVPSTLVPFEWLTDKIIGYKIPHVLFILDCCYAGAASRNLRRSLSTTDTKYSILCSAIATQLANIQPGKSPFGIFSNFLFDGLKDPEAVENNTDNVTVTSLFNYTKRMLSNKEMLLNQVLSIKQEPFYIEGGLGEFILTKTHITKSIDPRANIKAPLKSYYSKYRWIGVNVSAAGQITIDDLYDIVVKLKPSEFLTPIRSRDLTRYEPVKLSTFETYKNGMQLLGILKDKEPLELTTNGNNMFRRNQSNYNNVLLELIKNEFEKANLTLESLETLLRFRMVTRRIPTASELYNDVRKRLNIGIGVGWFSILLDLLSYTGYIRLTTRKTYYPYW